MVPKSFVQNQGLIFDDFSSESFEKKVKIKNLNKQRINENSAGQQLRSDHLNFV